ncbi:non-ribosomal peptide synthetase [Paludibacterium paludis]|uniref:Carrier domain-containing protein n=1 Tax=Paludibacterium paludis TaxID=1225769 RepID=A0A918P423_9NEIS|nr:non-ribosomal peptide synthetase [Paludibacterium paludis]GGY18492.1 hypothetical protein GCM10011289_22500 [Paludibacterium paludis]
MTSPLSEKAGRLLGRRLAQRRGAGEDPVRAVLKADPEARFEPFPLNDMQQAYWIGRRGDNQTGMHYYVERHTRGLVFSRLREAWQRLLERHDMLRVVVTENGEQRILPFLAGEGLPEALDLSSLDPGASDDELARLREALMHRKADLAVWPQHRVLWCDLGGGEGRLLMSLDIWCIDGHSVQTLINELAACYRDPSCALPAIGLSFRDYVLACREAEHGADYARALAYWRARLPDLPAAPALPLAADFRDSDSPRFARYAMALPVSRTQALRALVANQGLTLATLLAACYAEVLARWSGSRRFLLNMPRFNRKPLHPDVNAVLGEFATFTLLAVNHEPGSRFGERIAAMQQQLWRDMEHDAVSGVRVLRELNQLSGGRSRAPAPVVFTSLPELAAGGTDNFSADTALLGEVVDSLTQTPQVWLDCQYFQENGGLRINWDYLEARFPAGMVGDMFSAFEALVGRLAAPGGAAVLDEISVVSLPTAQLARRAAVNDTARDWLPVPLAQRLTEAADRWSDRLALAADGRTYRYGDLFARAGALAAQLREGEGRVAIRIGKSAEQVIAVLACVLAGRSYVPLDIEQPIARQRAIAAQAEVGLVLGADALEAWTGEAPVLAVSRWRTEPPARSAALPAWRADKEIYVLYTSGSTGRPKGVVVREAGLANLLEHNGEWLRLGDGDRVFGISALHHDMSVYDLFGALSRGAALVLPCQSGRRDPGHWLARMKEFGVTYWNSVPALMTMLLDYAAARGETLDSLRRVTLGGDWLPNDIGTRLAGFAPGVEVHSVGGPTEVTVWNISHRLTAQDASRDRIPYGRPIANSRYYIVDESGEDCPDWVTGEMVCAGAGVSSGYLDPAEPGQASFGPLANREAHSYRTGDLGRYLPGGEIEFVGRRDSQIKLHGYRIEPGEIEAVLQRHPSVVRAVVQRRDEPHPQLLAWVESDADDESLRAHAALSLPAAMVPSLWLRCDEWPLSGNGKIDRQALAARPLQPRNAAGTAIAPRGELEVWLAERWSELLGQAVTDRCANFFHLGGDSLLAVRLSAEIRRRSGLEQDVPRIFAAPRFDQMAEDLARQWRERSPDGGNLEGGGAEPVGFPARPAGAAPLSWSQRGLWLIEQREPGNTAYALPMLLQLRGALDADLLVRAVDRVLARHELLRCRFVYDSTESRPCLLPDAEPPRTRREALPAPGDLDAWLRDFASAGFDLTSGLSARAILLNVAPDWHVLALSFHHIVFDGWSFGVLLRQVSETYAALRAGRTLPSGEFRYGDYAYWQQARPDEAEARDFWLGELAGLPVLDLVTDRPRPARMDWAGASVGLAVPGELVARLDALAGQQGATLFMVLLSAFQLLLGRYAQQEEVVVGTYVAGREQEASHDMLGCFVNNLVMRARWFPDQSFLAFLAQNRERILAAFAHQHYPFERLVALSGQERDPSRHPLYQAGFAMQPRETLPELDGGVTLRRLRPPLRAAHMDMDLYAVPEGDGLWLELNYLTGLFDGSRMQRLLQHYVTLLGSIVAEPHRPVVSLRYWPGQWPAPMPRGADPVIDLPQRLYDALRSGGERCALVEDGVQTRYSELLALSQRLAEGLRREGAGPGVAVGVYLPRSTAQIGVMLAILFTGAVYVPLDADYPEARIATMLELARPVLVISDEAHRDRLPEPFAGRSRVWREMAAVPPGEAVVCRPLARDCLYLLFTSGSTGQPKGVRGTWLTAQSRTNWLASAYPLQDGDCCAIRTPLNFIDALWEVLDPLLAGCRCVIVPGGVAADSSRLLPMMCEAGVTRMVIVPALMRAWLQVPGWLARWRSLRLLLSSGEAPRVEELDALYRIVPELVFVNCYGSSEVADVTAHAWPREGQGDRSQVVLGRPLPGCRIVLRDRWGQAVAPGLSGQIHVAGDHVFAGYLNGKNRVEALGDGDPEFPMGDWGRWRDDGMLIHEGRRDDLVKIRGNRVELDEVGRQLRQLSGTECLVLAVPDPAGGLQLVAWLEGMDGEGVSRVRSALLLRLPAYMVPTRFETPVTLPRLPNGKVDRARLLASLSARSSDPAPAASERERQLAVLIAPLAGCDPGSIDPRRGLYEIGLNSLSLASVHAVLTRAFPSAGLALTELFQFSSLSELARRLAGDVTAEAGAPFEAPVPRREHQSARKQRFVRKEGSE